MRISRPGIWYLNPYINDVDPNNISYGNPRLDAEQQHNFNVNYGTFSQKLNFNATLSYSFAKNAVTGYSFIRDGVTHNTYANIGRNQTVGSNIYVSWTPSQLIRTYLNGGLNYTDIQSTENSALRNSGFSGRAYGGLTFTFPGDLRVGANGGAFMSRVQLQTKQTPFYFYSFSVMKSFLDKNAGPLTQPAGSFFNLQEEFLHHHRCRIQAGKCNPSADAQSAPECDLSFWRPEELYETGTTRHHQRGCDGGRKQHGAGWHHDTCRKLIFK